MSRDDALVCATEVVDDDDLATKRMISHSLVGDPGLNGKHSIVSDGEDRALDSPQRHAMSGHGPSEVLRPRRSKVAQPGPLQGGFALA